MCMQHEHMQDVKRRKFVFIACLYVYSSPSYGVFKIRARVPFMKEDRAYFLLVI